MSLFQCRQRRINEGILADHLHFIFLYPCKLSLLANVGITALQCPKLTLPLCLPGTGVVITDSSCTSVEQCLFYRLQMAFRYEET